MKSLKMTFHRKACAGRICLHSLHCKASGAKTPKKHAMPTLQKHQEKVRLCRCRLLYRSFVQIVCESLVCMNMTEKNLYTNPEETWKNAFAEIPIHKQT